MKLRTAAVIATVFTLTCCVGTGVLGGGYQMLTNSASAGCGSDALVDPDASLPKVGDLSDEQRHYAAVIIAVGQQKKVPARGWVIAIATALQESNLHNLGDLGARNDHDSLGLFQQRPSTGWGTPAQILDPVYAAGKFYDKLVTIKNWATIPLTDAAQAVQISAYPDAYAKHEPLATTLVDTVASSGKRAIPVDLEQCLSNCPAILSRTPASLQNPTTAVFGPDPAGAASTLGLLKISGQSVARIARNGHGPTLRIAQDLPEPTDTVGSSGSWAIPSDLEQCLSNCPAILSTATSGDPLVAASAVACEWVAPVLAPVVSGFRTAQRPTHNGVDLGAARGTPIRAASAGTVVVVRCNVVPASHGCDRDGSPSTPGCGWYVDIRHAGEVYTRYCHMLTRPAVVEGQAVAVGQVIGVVGSSGHSSGPHLHFEVHVRGRSEGAVDPVVFMAGRGVRLG